MVKKKELLLCDVNVGVLLGSGAGDLESIHSFYSAIIK